MFAEQYGIVSVNETELTGLVDALSEEQLSRFVSAAAHSRPLEYFSWTGKETTVANLVEYLVVHVLRNCGFGNGEARFANGVWTVTMRAHGHGFVQWAKAYIPAVFREYHGIAPNIVTMNNTIQFTVADAGHGKTKGPASTEIVATQ